MSRFWLWARCGFWFWLTQKANSGSTKGLLLFLTIQATAVVLEPLWSPVEHVLQITIKESSSEPVKKSTLASTWLDLVYAALLYPETSSYPHLQNLCLFLFPLLSVYYHKLWRTDHMQFGFVWLARLNRWISLGTFIPTPQPMKSKEHHKFLLTVEIILNITFPQFD